MEWTQVLRRHASRVALGEALGQAQAEVLSWAHAPHLSDNVPHRHTYFEVCTVGRWGGGTFTLSGRPHAIAPGDTFFARPGEEHRIQNTQPRRIELFWVSFALAPTATTLHDSLFQSFARSGVAVRPGDNRSLAIWSALRQAAQPEDRACGEVLQSLARALLLSLLRAGSDEPHLQHQAGAVEDEHATARLAVRYIHDNLNRRLPIEEVASHVHVSPRHLARLFRAFASTSPADYIEAARIQRARHLLGHEHLSVKQTSRAVGYADVQHFTRAFSRRARTSPAAFQTAFQTDAHRVIEEARADGDIV